MRPGCLAEALRVSSPVCGSPNSLLIIPLWGKCYDHVCACAHALPCAHVGICPFMCVEVKGHLQIVFFRYHPPSSLLRRGLA